MVIPNCLCKLKYFTFFLRDLVLERAEWLSEKKASWPILHDLIAITTISCLKNEGFKLLKNSSAFGWVKCDNETYLREFRSVNGKITIYCRLNGFTKFIIVFEVSCADGELQLKGRVHNSEDEDLAYYEMKAEEKISSSIHFALCGGYYQGQAVYLQYDVPGLLKRIYQVIEPVKEYVTENWQFNSIMEYIKNLPSFLSDTIFGDKNNLENESDETNGEGKYKTRHTNPENLMFLSPEMCEAQIQAELVLYHYRDNEKFINNNTIDVAGNGTFRKQIETQIDFLHENDRKNHAAGGTTAIQNFESLFLRKNPIRTNNEQLQISNNMDAMKEKLVNSNMNHLGLNVDGNSTNCYEPQVVFTCEEFLNLQRDNTAENKENLFRYSM